MLAARKDSDGCVADLLTLLHDALGRLVPLDDPIPDVELRAVERELGVSLPPSYLAFLRHFGSGRVAGHELYGLPRHWLWGDVVLMNELGTRRLPSAFVKFGRARKGRLDYSNTGHRDADEECPVVVPGLAGNSTLLAAGFLDYLHRAVREGL